MKVSRSGYYYWRKYGLSAREKERVQLIPLVKKFHEKSRGTYGSRRIAKDLESSGFPCGKQKASTLMK